MGGSGREGREAIFYVLGKGAGSLAPKLLAFLWPFPLVLLILNSVGLRSQPLIAKRTATRNAFAKLEWPLVGMEALWVSTNHPHPTPGDSILSSNRIFHGRPMLKTRAASA